MKITCANCFEEVKSFLENETFKLMRCTPGCSKICIKLEPQRQNDTVKPELVTPTRYEAVKEHTSFNHEPLYPGTTGKQKEPRTVSGLQMKGGKIVPVIRERRGRPAKAGSVLDACKYCGNKYASLYQHQVRCVHNPEATKGKGMKSKRQGEKTASLGTVNGRPFEEL